MFDAMVHMLVWCRKIKAGSSALFSNISCFTFPNSIMSFDILSWLVSDSGEKWLHLYQWEPIHKEVRCSLDIMSLWVVDGIFMVLTSIILFRVGWRKISCFFNISFEIKDHSIEFDENRNVNRAEFLVRASMTYAVFYAIASHFSVTFTCPFTSIHVFFIRHY